jgi:hypothetical protein
MGPAGWTVCSTEEDRNPLIGSWVGFHSSRNLSPRIRTPDHDHTHLDLLRAPISSPSLLLLSYARAVLRPRPKGNATARVRFPAEGGGKARVGMTEPETIAARGDEPRLCRKLHTLPVEAMIRELRLSARDSLGLDVAAGGTGEDVQLGKYPASGHGAHQPHQLTAAGAGHERQIVVQDCHGASVAPIGALLCNAQKSENTYESVG